MPDSFDASHAPGSFHVVPPRRRDLKGGAVIRVAEVVMVPLTLLVSGTVALAAMVLWGVWVVVCRWIRPLLYTIAGIALVAMVLLAGGVMGYAYHAYQAASGRLVASAGLPEMPLGASDLAPPPGLPAPGPLFPPRRMSARVPSAAPQTDPFGLKRQ